MAKKKKKKIQKPERPVLKRHEWREAGYLVLDPSKLAALSGTFFASLALLFFLARQLLGREIPIGDVVLGVVKTFVVSYAATGLFVLYLLWVAERELPAGQDELSKGHGLHNNGEESPEESETADGAVPAGEGTADSELPPVETEELQ